jgi:CRISPR-associated protein Cmr1
MKNGYLRYYKRERVTAECEIITPMFLGGPDQNAQWRGAPFKALLRKWWRIAHGAGMTSSDLYENESQVFGAAGEKGSNLGKSKVVITLQADAKACEQKMPNIAPVNQPECQLNEGNVSPLLYLAGMGLMAPNGNVKHSYFSPGEKFVLTIEAGHHEIEGLKPVFRLLQLFGTIGGRSRNGWGSFILNIEKKFLEAPKLYFWKEGFDCDYPSLLGKDGTGELIWKTQSKDAWKEVMRDLAEAYIAVRAKSVRGYDKLDPGAGSANERHLLGIPLTHHAAFGNTARHASPLHFKVLKHGGQYQGVILHLPHRHSDQQPIFERDKEKQIKVWEKVHHKLDAISNVQRTTMAGM